MDEKIKKDLQKIAQLGYCFFGYKDFKEVIEVMEYSIKDSKQIRQALKYIKNYLKVVDERFKEYHQEWKRMQEAMELYL